MNIYIGYKYRNLKDKESLKENLSKISDSLSSLGHKTFILGRDEFEWSYHTAASKSLTPIIKNLKKNDVLLAVMECASRSNGLLFESFCAKIFGKKMILAVKKGVSSKPFSHFTKNIIEFEDYDDLARYIQTDLDKHL